MSDNLSSTRPFNLKNMDYEKKYNEALAIAKETYETQPVYRAWLEKMFPELRESEALEKFLSIDHTGIIDSILKEAGIKKPYMDGNQFCILLGEDLQSGICGFGKTKKEALIDFLKAAHLYFNKVKSIESSHWKPSEEQMKALERTTRLANFGLEEDRRKALVSLHEHLKNL